MFKNFLNQLKQFFKKESANQEKCDTEKKCEITNCTCAETESNLAIPSNTEFESFANNLSSAMNGFSLAYSTPDEVINEYLEKYPKESLFEALMYIFAYNNKESEGTSSSCALIRYSRDELCKILIKLNVTPISTWLKILSHDYKNELYYEDFTLQFLCDTIPEEDLIPFVLEDFKNILKRTECFDYHYFARFDEWKQKFHQNISYVLSKTQFYSAKDCLNLVNIFPECATDIYMFVLKKYYLLLENINLSNVIWSQVSIIDDVLQPLADHHLYKDDSTINITEDFVINFLSTFNSNFFTLIRAKQIFEENFNINPKVLDTLVKSNVRRYINKLMTQKVSIAKISDTLTSLFSISYAYNYFMDNIHILLHCQGIELYAFLVKYFSDNKELLSAEHCCFEYD